MPARRAESCRSSWQESWSARPSGQEVKNSGSRRCTAQIFDSPVVLRFPGPPGSEAADGAGPRAPGNNLDPPPRPQRHDNLRARRPGDGRLQHRFRVGDVVSRAGQSHAPCHGVSLCRRSLRARARRPLHQHRARAGAADAPAHPARRLEDHAPAQSGAAAPFPLQGDARPARIAAARHPGRRTTRWRASRAS